jgi:GTP-binding protein
MFVEPATQVYEGMIVGENSRPSRYGRQHHPREEADEHACLVGRRGRPVDTAPPLSLEQAIEFINDDELVEITPKFCASGRKCCRRT